MVPVGQQCAVRSRRVLRPREVMGPGQLRAHPQSQTSHPSHEPGRAGPASQGREHPRILPCVLPWLGRWAGESPTRTLTGTTRATAARLG